MCPAGRVSTSLRKVANVYLAGRGDIPLKEVVLSHDLQVAVWQWPQRRVLWGKQLRQGELVSVVAEDVDGAMLCSLRGDHFYVIWPKDVGLKA